MMAQCCISNMYMLVYYNYGFISLLVEKISEVSDALCVGQSIGADERVVLFLKMKDGKKYVLIYIQLIW